MRTRWGMFVWGSGTDSGVAVRRGRNSFLFAAALVLTFFTANIAVAAAAADLSVVKTDSSDPVHVGEDFTYTLAATNENAGGTGAWEFVDVIPASLSVTSVPAGCTLVGSTLTCDGSQELGGGETQEVTVPVTGLSPGTVSNTVSVTNAGDPVPGDNDDTEQTTVVPARNLSVTKTGSGTVTSSPAGINCGNDCSGVYDDGEFVTLTATADSGASFSSWGEDCEFAFGDTCTVVMNSDKSAVANFTRAPVASFNIEPENPAEGLYTLNSSETTGATRLIWNLTGGSGRGAGALSSFETSPLTPFTTLRIKAPGTYEVVLSAVGTGGRTTTEESFVVKQTSKKMIDPRLSNVMVSSSSLLGLEHPTSSDFCDSNRQVVFGTVDARGCFFQVLASDQIPERERPVAGEWFDSQLKQTGCGFVKIGNGTCFTKPEYLGVVYSTRAVKMNGMTVTPQNGASVVFYPPTGKVVSADAKVTLKGPGFGTVTAHNGPLNLSVGTGSLVGTTGRFKRPLPMWSFNARNLPKVGGFSLDGEVSLSLVAQEGKRFTELAMNMTLPEAFSTSANTRPSGAVAITADNDNGVVLDQLYLGVPEAFLGGVRLANLSFTYKARGEPNATPPCPSTWWKATAEVFLIPSGGQRGDSLSLAPPPDREGVAFCAGGFHSAGGEFTFGEATRPQIFPGVFLDSIGFNMALDPTVFSRYGEHDIRRHRQGDRRAPGRVPLSPRSLRGPGHRRGLDASGARGDSTDQHLVRARRLDWHRAAGRQRPGSRQRLRPLPISGLRGSGRLRAPQHLPVPGRGERQLQDEPCDPALRRRRERGHLHRSGNIHRGLPRLYRRLGTGQQQGDDRLLDPRR